jgi:hypothetical protein
MNTKRLAIATSIILFAAISGQAAARTVTTGENHWTNAMNSSGEIRSPQNEPFSAMPSQATEESNTHRYTGGPKSND